MKKIIISVLLLIPFYKISHAQTGWFIQPSFTSQNLYDCKQSAYFYLYLGSDNGNIFRSTNGGYNWAVHDFHDNLLSTSSIKYIYGMSNDNWAFVGQDAAFGYYVSPIDTLMRITGVMPQPDLEAYSYLSGIFFYAASIAAGENGKFYIKDDTAWKSFTIPTGMATGRNINYSWGNLFVGDGGLIMRADSIGYMLSGGRRMSWKIVASGTTKNLYAIMGGGGSPGYTIVGEDGTILQSTDYGNTFQSVYSPTTEDLFAVWNGYASLICGANGTILRKYSDTWYKQISPTNSDLYFIVSLGYSEYISGGENGTFLRTTDGGGTLKRFIGTSAFQGFYNPATNLMIPDTIKITVRASVSPYNIIDKGNAITNVSGYSNVNIGPIALNDVQYYIQVNHRNSIETWSKTTLAFSNNDLYYDFIISANKAYGDNQIKVDNSPVRYAFYGGDVNQDGTVDATDLSLIDNDANNFVTGYVSTDVTGDNIIDASDAALTDNNAGNFVSIERP